MKKFAIVVLLVIVMATLIGCGGGSTSGGTSGGDVQPPPPTTRTVVKGIYQAPRGHSIHSVSANEATQSTIPDTVIVGADNIFTMNLSGFNMVYGRFTVDTDGTLHVGSDARWIKADGTVVTPIQFSGTMTNSRLTGTTSAGNFDVTLTDLQNQQLDMATKSGVPYLTTVNNLNQIILFRFTVNSSTNDGKINGLSFDTLEEAQAAIDNHCAPPNTSGCGRYAYIYEGTWLYTKDMNGVVSRTNALTAGVQWHRIENGQNINKSASTGMAYFDSNGSFVMTAYGTGQQFTAVLDPK